MPHRIPRATYRLQLSEDLPFDRVRRLLPYLQRLGVDTVYLSPILAARTGSRHGYDGIDPGRIDRGRGGPVGFARLARAAERRGMGILLDIVPNHLAASLETPAWVDLLRRGPRSRQARLFDVDWHRTTDGRPAVVLPWLEESVEASFDRGTLAFAWDRGALVLRLGSRRLPTSPRSHRWFATHARARASGRRRGPTKVADAPDRIDRLNAGTDPADRAVRDRLLALQWYRLVPWRDTAAVNYRRFFDISDLVGVRSEDPSAFAYLHRGVWTAIRSPAVIGLRVDHVDGLADPEGYLRRLRSSFTQAAPDRRVPYLVVEKILAADESLPPTWPVDGTTGYEAMARLTGILVREEDWTALRTADRPVGRSGSGSFRAVAREAKREVIERLFPGERVRLARRLQQLVGSGRGDLDTASEVIDRVTAALPVYRTYGRPGALRPSDRSRIEHALADVRDRAPALARRAGAALTASRWIEAPPARSGDPPFLQRWQMWTGAVAAKGVEDTAFYRDARCLAANEVGSDPDRIGSSLDEFHRFMEARLRTWPDALTATSTHDTKWGEDTRARLVALAEWAVPFARATAAWRERTRPDRGPAGEGPAPDAAWESRLDQTLVATLPPGRRIPATYLRRIDEYLVKSVREAKVRSSWSDPDRRYEDAQRTFVRELLLGRGSARFRRDLRTWARRVRYFGAYYGLALALLRATVPGVPDLYQGSEGWNLSLVDPDNRRPVPFARWSRALDRFDAGGGRLAATSPPSERDKLAVTALSLRFRARHPALCARGLYVPLHEVGPRGRPARVLAFARRWKEDWAVVAIGRSLAGVTGHRLVPPTGRRWGSRALSLPEGAPIRWSDELAGGSRTALVGSGGPSLPLAELFHRFPIALLTHAGSPDVASRANEGSSDDAPPEGRSSRASVRRSDKGTRNHRPAGTVPENEPR